MYQRLISYKKEYGNCRVPAGWKTDRQLAIWVHQQRLFRDALDDTQKNLLNEIGFDWDPLETMWNATYQRLQEFVNEHGHCHVIRDSNDMSLYDWVTTQRSLYTKGFLSPERITRLNELSFSWSTPWEYNKITINLEAQWKATYYGKLMALRRHMGTVTYQPNGRTIVPSRDGHASKSSLQPG
jgi:hypothetical protein